MDDKRETYKIITNEEGYPEAQVIVNKEVKCKYEDSRRIVTRATEQFENDFNDFFDGIRKPLYYLFNEIFKYEKRFDYISSTNIEVNDRISKIRNNILKISSCIDNIEKFYNTFRNNWLNPELTKLRNSTKETFDDLIELKKYVNDIKE